MDKKKIVLTGDRPTGPLHLGHYVGSLINRVHLQDTAQQFIMIADAQALTDNADNPEKIKQNIIEVALDYLSVGIDPNKSVIFIQSMVPQLFELTMYYLNLVSWNRLKHNPTVKAEITQRGFGETVPAGFMIYPISQAADITAFKADIVPVGEDQLPMLEQTSEIVRKFNRTYQCDVLVEPKVMASKLMRLPGTDGKAKMSKSLNNAIFLSEPFESLSKKVKRMYTDPNHLKVEDPGKVEGNPVFTYLDAFATDKEKLEEMKAHYQRGGLGDSVVKKYLLEVLEDFIAPIRTERARYAQDKEYVYRILKEHSEKAAAIAQQTLDEVKRAMGIDYFLEKVNI
ncbi:MAG: tryptophan--tRNA ligase [Chlamydiae bacterium CG10_big_fil_rev_8_21_14_0_10_35_9]|nr:MAG: tryptophan--tRNA ligase [Chlamydiae bacterium CG10_big_fil_rev_8_21_14_0_10_35_9]